MHHDVGDAGKRVGRARGSDRGNHFRSNEETVTRGHAIVKPFPAERTTHVFVGDVHRRQDARVRSHPYLHAHGCGNRNFDVEVHRVVANATHGEPGFLETQIVEPEVTIFVSDGSLVPIKNEDMREWNWHSKSVLHGAGNGKDGPGRQLRDRQRWVTQHDRRKQKRGTYPAHAHSLLPEERILQKASTRSGAHQCQKERGPPTIPWAASTIIPPKCLRG